MLYFFIFFLLTYSSEWGYEEVQPIVKMKNKNRSKALFFYWMPPTFKKLQIWAPKLSEIENKPQLFRNHELTPNSVIYPYMILVSLCYLISSFSPIFLFLFIFIIFIKYKLNYSTKWGIYTWVDMSKLTSNGDNFFMRTWI